MSDLPTAPDRVRAYHVMTKPIGPICNLDCKYCFYLEKEQLYDPNEQFRMSDEVLEAYVRQYIEGQDVPEVSFAWQGGEPTLLGVDFFRKVVELQARYAGGKHITNAIQTNGTLLDDEWGAFLAEHDFLVGLSIDGPRELHDAYRVDKRQRPTFDLVTRGAAYLKKHGAEFNTLTVVNRVNSQKPLEVYRFLKEIGSGFMQFIPLVERTADSVAKELKLDLAAPPSLEEEAPESAHVTSWSVEPRTYGDFLIAIFDEWVQHDVGQTFVQIFDVSLGNWLGMPPSLCVFSPTCGNAMALEHDGNLYACDHYVYPQFHLGNVLNRSISEMVNDPQQRKFGQDKLDRLPRYCRECEVRFACHGECPKHRFLRTPQGEPGLNYLCAGYKRFFRHIDEPMRIMADLVRSRRPASLIMDWAAQRHRQAAWENVKRNDPCPCGSGRKFKQCCADKAAATGRSS
jgi:uncharacterized protein